MVQAMRSFQPNLNKAKIAIIEDDSSIHNLIMGSMLMKMNKVEAYQYKNARTAIHELFEKNMIGPPKLDALFIDIFLEDQTSGIDVLDYCQFIPQNVPVILMSSQFTDEQLERISKFKTTPVLLRKPFGAEEVVQLTKWVFDINSRRFQ